jgi:hypothetical protein
VVPVSVTVGIARVTRLRDGRVRITTPCFRTTLFSIMPTRTLLSLAATISSLAVGACQPTQSSLDTSSAEPSAASADAVRMHLQTSASDTPSRRQFVLSYGKGADTTRFLFTFVPKRVEADSSFALTIGALAPYAGSRAVPLIEALAAMHGMPPARPVDDRRRGNVAVDVGILGVGLSLGVTRQSAIAGAFTHSSPGPWTVLKLFLPSLDEDVGQPEIFLALNEDAGEARFLLKDSAYWPTLAPTLAGVFAAPPP